MNRPFRPPPDADAAGRVEALDWKRIEAKKGKLRPHMRAMAWVCRNSGATFIDWRVGEKAPTGD